METIKDFEDDEVVVDEQGSASFVVDIDGF
jgi:hypothetical protein